MADENERMHILDMIESGKISTEEGLRLLEILAQSEPAEPEVELEALVEPAAQRASAALPLEAAPETSAPAEDQPAEPRASSGLPPIGLPPDAGKWRRFWLIPLWVGVGITVLGGALMYRAFDASGIGFWFVCASLPFILGMLILVLGVQSHSAPWIHLRVQQEPGEKPERIAISFPIPVGITTWFLRTFGGRIKQLQGTSLDEIILALEKTSRAGEPIYIKVDEGDEGEKVEIYIG
ncbi:MAG: hypothetical protein JXB15_09070 [Anaerolineales bacterium]|nr:hypothetical protein [Anaerolineales bacterium]